MSVFAVNNLSFKYRKGNPILNNICFSIECGEIICLIGPNGCGKSTLLTQMLFPSNKNKNNIFINDRPFLSYSLIDRAKYLSYVPQKIQALELTVFQTVLLGLAPNSSNIFLKATDNDYGTVEKLLERFGLSDKKYSKLSNLSGGELQRTFIAHALAKKAAVYVFDEPMSALDPKYQNHFLHLIKDLASDGASVIFTTHNPNHLFSLKGIRMAIIDAEKKFYELDLCNGNDIKKIEDTFDNSIIVKFNKEHNLYMASFNMCNEGDI